MIDPTKMYNMERINIDLGKTGNGYELKITINYMGS